MKSKALNFLISTFCKYVKSAMKTSILLIQHSWPFLSIQKLCTESLLYMKVCYLIMGASIRCFFEIYFKTLIYEGFNETKYCPRSSLHLANF